MRKTCLGFVGKFIILIFLATRIMLILKQKKLPVKYRQSLLAKLSHEKLHESCEVTTLQNHQTFLKLASLRVIINSCRNILSADFANKIGQIWLKLTNLGVGSSC